MPVSGLLATTGTTSHLPTKVIQTIQKRDDIPWQLVHFTTNSIIQPLAIGAASMAEFYYLVSQAATGRWRSHEPPRQHLKVVWHRVAMVMIAQGIENIPWEVVAQYAEGMLNMVNNGHVAFTYDGYFLRPSETNWPHGLYVGLQILGQQEAVDFWLANGRHGFLDPSHP